IVTSALAKLLTVASAGRCALALDFEALHSMASGPRPQYRFIDIGANLTDPVFRGVYRGRQLHQDDFDAVLRRANEVGVERIIVTGGSLSESKAALHLCRDQLTAGGDRQVRLTCTVGCHPTRSSEMESDPAGYLNSLRQLVEANRDLVSAVAETGLDYDREHFAPREVQMRHFRSQVSLACQLRLPLFLHCRASHAEFRAVLSEFANQLPSPPGVVHTFDGSAKDAAELLAMGFYLGLNGCSLKTADNLRVVSGLPLDRLLLETDAPWCEVKPSHAGHSHVTPSSRFESRKAERWSPGCMVKGRNEPACILQVLQVVAATLGQPAEKVASAAFANTCRLFGLAEAAAPSTVEGDN
ncbi:hypothetical protein BOX15_Mlig018203g1, partial [Macrostomum lignano]